MNRIHIGTRACLTVSIVLVSFGVAFAEQQEDPIERVMSMKLSELLAVPVTTGTKTEQKVGESIVPVAVLTRRQIRRSGAFTIPEALRMIPGLNVRWNPMVQEFDIRGFGQHPFAGRVLLLIDGVPFNSWNKGGTLTHPAMEFFPIENVKQIEVLRGSGSSLYGENAFWGIINIISLSGEDFDGGSAEVRYGDLNTVRGNVQYGSEFMEGDGSLFGSIQVGRTQFPIAFWAEDQDSNFDSFDGFIKVKYQGFEFSYFRHQDELDGFRQPLGPTRFFISAKEIEQEIDIVAGRYSYESDDNTWAVHTEVSYAQRNGMHCGACHSFPTDPEEFGSKADHGSQLIGEVRGEYRGFEGHNLLLGVEGRNVDAGNHENELLANGGSVDGVNVVSAYTKPAVYIQDQISNLFGIVNVVAGVRYDGETHPELHGARWSPRIAASVNATEDLTVRASWGRSFHYPAFSLLYNDRSFINATSVATGENQVLRSFQPNPDLNSEEIQNTELSFEYNIEDQAQVKLNLFWTETSDFIVVVAGRSTFGWENHPDDTTGWGGELEVRADVHPGVQLFAGYSYQTHSQDGDGVDSSGKRMEIVYSPENKLSLGGEFDYQDFHATIEWMWKDEQITPSIWNFVDSRFDPEQAFVTGKLDPYSLLNVILQYEVPELRLVLSLLVKNVTDENTQETNVGGPSLALVGRQLYGEVEVSF